MASGQASQDSQYGPPNEDEIASVLYSVTDWYTVGLRLGLPTGELDDIRSHSGAKQQKKMLARMWLDRARERGETPKWSTLRAILTMLNMIKAVDAIDELFSGAGTSKKTESSSPKLDSRPTMALLQCVHGTNGERYRIIQKLAGRWREVADFLLGHSSSSVTSKIERDSQIPTQSEKCRDVFRRWLDGQPGVRQPVTWNELLTVLEDLEEGVLAGDLRTYVFE